MGTHLDDPFSHTPSILDTVTSVEVGLMEALTNDGMSWECRKGRFQERKIIS